MLFSVFSAFARVFWYNPGRRAILKCHKTGPQLFQKTSEITWPRAIFGQSLENAFPDARFLWEGAWMPGTPVFEGYRFPKCFWPSLVFEKLKGAAGLRLTLPVLFGLLARKTSARGWRVFCPRAGCFWFFLESEPTGHEFGAGPCARARAWRPGMVVRSLFKCCQIRFELSPFPRFHCAPGSEKPDPRCLAFAQAKFG